MAAQPPARHGQRRRYNQRHTAAGTGTLWADGFESGTLAADWTILGSAAWYVTSAAVPSSVPSP